MAFCPSCGSEVGNAKFCQNCGSAIEQNSSPNSKFCSNCGSEIDYKAEICPKCGVRQVSVSSQSSEKNVWVAVLLSLLIVGLGQFYLGLPKKGALLLILTIISWILYMMLTRQQLPYLKENMLKMNFLVVNLYELGRFN